MATVGKIFITRSGYDPEKGKHVKDPYLGPTPTLGACRPDVRRRLKRGDHVFVISGKVSGVDQFLMGGFEIADKIPATEAYARFPQNRLRKLEDGQLTGNIIVDECGRQHEFDDHNSFEERIKNYVVGKNLIALATPAEILKGRKQTLDALQEILERPGRSPFEVVGRFGTSLTEKQIAELREWFVTIKAGSN